jgi:hypothetical protein
MFCARWLLEILTGVHKTQKMPPPLIFSELHHEDGDELLNHIVRVTGDYRLGLD